MWCPNLNSPIEGSFCLEFEEEFNFGTKSLDPLRWFLQNQKESWRPVCSEIPNPGFFEYPPLFLPLLKVWIFILFGFVRRGVLKWIQMQGGREEAVFVWKETIFTLWRDLYGFAIIDFVHCSLLWFLCSHCWVPRRCEYPTHGWLGWIHLVALIIVNFSGRRCLISVKSN